MQTFDKSRAYAGITLRLLSRYRCYHSYRKLAGRYSFRAEAEEKLAITYMP